MLYNLMTYLLPNVSTIKCYARKLDTKAHVRSVYLQGINSSNPTPVLIALLNQIGGQEESSCPLHLSTIDQTVFSKSGQSCGHKNTHNLAHMRRGLTRSWEDLCFGLRHLWSRFWHHWNGKWKCIHSKSCSYFKRYPLRCSIYDKRQKGNVLFIPSFKRFVHSCEPGFSQRALRSVQASCRCEIDMTAAERFPANFTRWGQNSRLPTACGFY